MKPVSIPATNIYQESCPGGSRWVVYLGRKFTRAKPCKKRFPDYRAAKEWLEKEVEKRDQQGAAGFQLSPAQSEQALAAFRLLGGRAPLLEAVEDFVARKFPKAGTKTMSEVVEAWLKKKRVQGRSAVYLATVSDIYLAAAKRFSANINEVTGEQIENWLADKRRPDGTRISNNTFNHYVKDLHALFNFAKQSGWMAHNPAVEIELRTEQRPDIGIISPTQALAVLNAAAAQPGMPTLAFVVLALFAGIRTEELRRLTWDDVILDDEPRVLVRGSGAKNGEARVIDLPPNAVAWLMLKPFRSGNIGNPNSRRLARLRDAAGCWPKNAARHSFVSYKARRDGESTASEAAGHESVKITRKRYRALVSRKAAEAFFSIYPSTTADELSAMIGPARSPLQASA